MSYDETLVGLLSFCFAIVAAAIAAGPWHGPYELRSIAAIRLRFGKAAARGVWLVLAIAFLAVGTAIFKGVRPSYAVPASQVDLNR